MVFSSLTFLLYFLPIALVGYFVFGFNIKLQNAWLFIVSVIFYAWGEPSFVIVLLVSITLNWAIGLAVGKSVDSKPKLAKVFVFVAVLINMGLLFGYKYLGFAIGIVNGIFGREVITNPGLVLPIGISFFSFQALSYVVDVYRRDAKAQKNILNLGLYIAFFPQLIAGPIVRYNTIEKSIYSRKFTMSNLTIGVNRFAVGLVKKVLLANNLAIVADTVFSLMQIGTKYDTSVLMAWTGMLGFYYQLFFDFSAYSDMAIGLGRIFGFEFEENFNYPYISKSIGEQWRRWHISLGVWFKEYVYFPLGGSRVENQDLMVRNTFIVWLLTGLWHGASWTYVLWGVFQFVFIMGERIFEYEKVKLPAVIKIFMTQFTFCMGLVIFKCETLYLLKECVKNLFMFNGNSLYNAESIWMLKEYWMYFVGAAICSTPVISQFWNKAFNNKNKVLSFGANILYTVLLALGTVVAIISMIRGSYNPFIYFNF